MIFNNKYGVIFIGYDRCSIIYGDGVIFNGFDNEVNINEAVGEVLASMVSVYI